MTNTNSEAPREVQDPQVFEYLGWPIFWIFLLFFVCNFMLLLRQMESLEVFGYPIYNASTCRHTTGRPRRNTATSFNNGFFNSDSPSATETGSSESRTFFGWKPASLVFSSITSRNIQCNIVMVSGLVLLAQIIESFWIMEMFARYISQRLNHAADETPHAKSFILISLILHGIRCLGMVLIWLLFVFIGGFVVTMQYDFIRAVLNIRVEEHQAGYELVAKTEGGSRRNRDIDLESGRLEVIWESPEE